MSSNSSKQEGGGNAPLHIGAGVMGGSTGGASHSDLARGYTRPDEPSEQEPDLFGAIPIGGEREGGFLDRPEGWER